MIQTAADTYQLPAALPLEEGGLLLNARLAYETYGRIDPERTVVLLHDLPHSHRALETVTSAHGSDSGWARELLGVGKVLDPRAHPVLSVNLLGSPFGSTSPATLDDETGQPLGPLLPQLTILDMARGVSGLLRGLGLEKIKAVIGVGLGGMVALRLAALFRDLSSGVVAVGVARALPEPLREQLAMTRQLLTSDPSFLGGKYAPGEGPVRTLRNLRLDYLLRAAGDPRLTSESSRGQQLGADAEHFSRSFDPNCYALLAGALGRADLSDFLGRIRSRVLLVGGGVEGGAPVARVRDTYHQLTAEGVKAHFYEVPGEVQTLAQTTQKMRGALAEFLSML